jgi:uncharacterized protein (DUF1015 family)
MADVQPFRAVRYADPRPSVVAPPYDVVSPAERELLLARDPVNVAHLTLAEDEETAGELYRQWLASGVLVREERPAVWAWEQDVVSRDGDHRLRRGVVASLRAEPYGRGIVVPHERTHAGPIRSRLRLLRAVRAQLEPLLFLYEGGSPFEPPAGPPDIEAEGTRCWRLADPSAAAVLADRRILIADGHHRYEAALAYAAEHGGPGDARVMAVLVSEHDPGLEILPTHRFFDRCPPTVPVGEPTEGLDDALERLSREPADRSAAVLYRDGAATLLRGDPGELDVELVDRFGLDGISYTTDAGAAAQRADSTGGCALLVRPTPIHEVFVRAARGEVMPQKATHFFPKLTSGLLFHPLDES